MTIASQASTPTSGSAPGSEPSVSFLTVTAGSSLFHRALTALNGLRAEVPDHQRISDDEQGLVAAMALALRADCTRRRVGVFMVDVFGRTVDTGRNGAPPGRPGCLSAGACPRGRLTYDQVTPGSSYAAGAAGACIAIHGEMNALLNSDPAERRGGVIYISDPPCDDCSKHLAGSGLARAVWPVFDPSSGAVTIHSYDLAGPIGGHLS